MDWQAFQSILAAERPRYYVTQLTAPTLQNDLYGTFLAKSHGAVTMAFGTHITPMPRETLQPYPSLDFGLRGEPDLTLRDLIDHLEGNQFTRRRRHETTSSPGTPRPPLAHRNPRTVDPISSSIKGLVWRRDGERHRQSRPAVHRRPRRFPGAAVRAAATRAVSDAARQGTLLLRRHEPRLSGRLHLLHQARLLRPDDANAVAGKTARGDPASSLSRRAARAHVRRPVHGQSGAGC